MFFPWCVSEPGAHVAWKMERSAATPTFLFALHCRTALRRLYHSAVIDTMLIRALVMCSCQWCLSSTVTFVEVTPYRPLCTDAHARTRDRCQVGVIFWLVLFVARRCLMHSAVRNE